GFGFLRGAWIHGRTASASHDDAVSVPCGAGISVRCGALEISTGLQHAPAVGPSAIELEIQLRGAEVRFKMPKNAVMTIRDVARESGYSASTVSIVLNNAPLSRYIPAETKLRIETAARRLGYRPNPLARSLRSQRSNVIGVMVFDITDPYCTPILRGI